MRFGFGTWMVMSQTVDELNLAAVDIVNIQQITVHSILFQPSHHEAVLIRGCFSPGSDSDSVIFQKT